MLQTLDLFKVIQILFAAFHFFLLLNLLVYMQVIFQGVFSMRFVVDAILYEIDFYIYYEKF